MFRTPRTLRLIPILLTAPLFAQAKPDVKPAEKPAEPAEAEEEEPRGLRLNEPGAFDGLTIIAPLRSKDVHLVDMDGQGRAHLATRRTRPARGSTSSTTGTCCAAATRIRTTRRASTAAASAASSRRSTGTASVVWEYELATDERRLHHDVEPHAERQPARRSRGRTTRGRKRSRAAATRTRSTRRRASGRTSSSSSSPRGRTARRSCGQWRAWDHLVQDRDPKKPGYAKLSDHPGPDRHQRRPPLRDEGGDAGGDGRSGASSRRR